MFTLLPKNRLVLVQSLVHALCGDAHISLEGDLSRCREDLTAIRGASGQETTILKMNTLSPAHDFIVLPLETDTLDAIATGILPRIGIARHVWHIQMEKQGALQFAAYDNFDTASVGELIPEVLLAELVQRQALRSYHRDLLAQPTLTR